MPPPYPQQPVMYRPTPYSGAAVAGFVISLLGMLATFGLLSPIGAVVSGIGLADTSNPAIKRGRGLAGWGLGLGILGSLWLVLFGLAFLGSLIG